jgi:cellulose synthase (UDP-forming)
MDDGAGSAPGDQLKQRLYYVLALALCVLALSGLVLRGRAAVTALTWGWEDIAIPITTEFKHGQQVNYGVYDRQNRSFSQAKGVAIEHIFVSWLSSDSNDAIRYSFQYANERNRWLMITIEPSAVDARNTYQLLDDVVAGMYDSVIASVCRTIGSLQSSMFVRWGHEMERGDVRYPWSGANGDSYIAAYRHFATRCRADAPKILLVWSPKGERGLAEFYPGKEYVDFVGLSLYALPAYDLDHFGKVTNFRDAFTLKYNRVIAFDKPVIIAEMGVSGDPSYQTRWMADFFRSLRHFPLLRTVVYFNGKDSPGAWPEKYGIPEWTIDPNTFE